MPASTKYEFILQFERILADMKRKNPDTYYRNILFLSGERLEGILPILQKFFPSEIELIKTLNRKDIDLMLMRIMRSEVAHLQGDGERLVSRARQLVQHFGYLPPVAFFFSFNGAEIYEAMVERIYTDLKKRGHPRALSEIWRKFSATFQSSFETKTVFTKDLMFKIRQRLKNYLEKDARFVIDARSPKKLFLRLVEWGDQPLVTLSADEEPEGDDAES
jgi:hypothetical protein